MHRRLSAVVVASAAAVAWVATSTSPTSAQTSAPVLSVSVVGASVTATWTAVPGATSYRADVGTYAGGTNVISANVGNMLSASGGLGVGTYFIRVYPVAGAAVGPVSNEVTFDVGTPRPGAPGGFAATLNGSTLTFGWSAPTTGGPPSAYVLQAGTQFNLSNLAPGVNVGSVLAYTVPNITSLLPPGTYFARLVAVNGTGSSNPSDEAVFTLGNLPGVPTPNGPVINGSTVTLSWNPPAGGLAPTSYTIEGRGGDPRALGTAATVNGNTTSYTAPGLPNGSYYWRVRAFNGSTPGGVFGTASFFVGPPPVVPAGPRTPNPGTGRSLPRPTYGQGVVRAIAAAYPGDLRNSCVETGGNNLWLFKLLRELRRQDTRWQLNWKRGNAGDMSQDVVTYNYGSLPDEGTADVYIIDTIGGHCGGNPGWNWEDVTDRTVSGGSIGRGTLQPYVAAGFTP